MGNLMDEREQTSDGKMISRNFKHHGERRQQETSNSVTNVFSTLLS